MIPPEFAEHPAFARHFEVEARAIARLDTPACPPDHRLLAEQRRRLPRAPARARPIAVTGCPQGGRRQTHPASARRGSSTTSTHTVSCMATSGPRTSSSTRQATPISTDFGIALRHLEAQVGTRAGRGSAVSGSRGSGNWAQRGRRQIRPRCAGSLTHPRRGDRTDPRSGDRSRRRRTARATASAFIVDLEESLGDTRRATTSPRPGHHLLRSGTHTRACAHSTKQTAPISTVATTSWRNSSPKSPPNDSSP